MKKLVSVDVLYFSAYGDFSPSVNNCSTHEKDFFVQTMSISVDDRQKLCCL